MNDFAVIEDLCAQDYGIARGQTLQVATKKCIVCYTADFSVASRDDTKNGCVAD